MSNVQEFFCTHITLTGVFCRYIKNSQEFFIVFIICIGSGFDKISSALCSIKFGSEYMFEYFLSGDGFDDLINYNMAYIHPEFSCICSI